MRLLLAWVVVVLVNCGVYGSRLLCLFAVGFPIVNSVVFIL